MCTINEDDKMQPVYLREEHTTPRTERGYRAAHLPTVKGVQRTQLAAAEADRRQFRL